MFVKHVFLHRAFKSESCDAKQIQLKLTTADGSTSRIENLVAPRVNIRDCSFRSSPACMRSAQPTRRKKEHRTDERGIHSWLQSSCSEAIVRTRKATAVWRRSRVTNLLLLVAYVYCTLYCSIPSLDVLFAPART
jgi:hypothetical protein